MRGPECYRILRPPPIPAKINPARAGQVRPPDDTIEARGRTPRPPIRLQRPPPGVWFCAPFWGVPGRQLARITPAPWVDQLAPRGWIAPAARVFVVILPGLRILPVSSIFGSSRSLPSPDQPKVAPGPFRQGWEEAWAQNRRPLTTWGYRTGRPEKAGGNTLGQNRPNKKHLGYISASFKKLWMYAADRFGWQRFLFPQARRPYISLA